MLWNLWKVVVWTAQTTITCVTGRWNTSLDASWYRVDSRLVTIDEQGKLLVCHQDLVNANIFSLLSALWLVDDSTAVVLRYVLTRDRMMSFCFSVSSSVVHLAVFLVFSWLVHVHSWSSAHLKPWTAQDVISLCSSHSCLTGPNSLYCGKTFGSGAQCSVW